MRYMVIFPNSARQMIAIIAKMIRLLKWYNWGVLQFFDICTYYCIIICEL
jgi:hypothetical protein